MSYSKDKTIAFWFGIILFFLMCIQAGWDSDLITKLTMRIDEIERRFEDIKKSQDEKLFNESNQRLQSIRDLKNQIKPSCFKKKNQK